MTLSRARALRATSRKRIGVAALTGAERVTRLADRHGTSRKFVRAQRELARQAVDLAFAEPSAPSRFELFPRVSDAWGLYAVSCGTRRSHFGEARANG